MLRLTLLTVVAVLISLSTIKAQNQAPTADAGLNKTVVECNSIQLIGKGTDPEGKTLTYKWTLPQGLTGNSITSRITIKASNVTKDTTYKVKLVTNDGELDSQPDSVFLTVTNSANLPPVADAGKDIYVTEKRSCNLLGTVSDPNCGDVLNSNWTSLDGINLIKSQTSAIFIAPAVIRVNLMQM